MSEPGGLVDAESMARFLRLCEMSDERMARMSPAERDGLLQSHMAAAMSPTKKLELLSDMMESVMVLRRGVVRAVEADLDALVREAGA